MGARGLRLQGRRVRLVRRHLLLQLHEDRAAAGRPAGGRGARADAGGRGRDRPRGARGPLRRARRSRSSCPPRSGGACSRGSTTSASRSSTRTRSRNTSAPANVEDRIRSRSDLPRRLAGGHPDRGRPEAAVDRPAARHRQPGDAAAAQREPLADGDHPQHRAGRRPEGVDRRRAPATSCRSTRRSRPSPRRGGCATSRASATTTSTPPATRSGARRTSSPASTSSRS